MKWQIRVLYHSPSANKSEFLTYLKSTLETYCEGCNNNIIIGDFNINININTAYTAELINIFSSMAMKQLISFDIRVTEFSSTKIDLLYSTSDQVKTKCLNSCHITDHQTVEFSVPVEKELRMRLQ